MNWKTLSLLIAAVAGAGILVWKGDAIAPRIGLRAAPTEAPASATVTALSERLTAAALTKIEITPSGSSETVRLDKSSGTWVQPGNWPVAQSEVKRLIDTLTSLRSRFQPIALAGESADLTPYGLAADQKPVTVKADLGGETLTLTFGQPKGQGTSFDTSTYCRVDAKPEVLRLAPDTFAKVNKTIDAFRRKSLFPEAERVRITGGEPPPNPMNPTPPMTGLSSLITDSVASIRIQTKDGTYTLKRSAPMPQPKVDPDRPTAEPALAANRLALAWELAEPLRDRVDPAKLRSILTSIPELWAESFVRDRPVAETGLDQPEKSIIVTKTNGQSLTIRIGKESRQVTRMEGPPPSPFNPRQPPPQMTVEIYSYAKLDDNPQVFELRTDKLNDLFGKVDELRDASLARFETGDVQDVSVAVKGQPPVKLVKRKGNPNAEKDDDRQDRWYVGEGAAALLAESSKITELLDGLNRLEARNSAPGALPGAPPPPADKAILDGLDAKKLSELGFDPAAGTKVTLTVQPKVAEGDTPIPPRTITFLLGKQDADKKKLNVMVDGWPRVNVVEDAVYKLIDRPALAYRGRRLFDTAELKLNEVKVSAAGVESFALKQDSAEAAAKWKLVKPVASETDETKAGQLTGDLSRLEATEYVNDAPKPDELAKYGLDKPRFTADLGFTGTNAKPMKLEIGAAREGKPEVFARLNGGSVFALNSTIVETLDKGALGLLPLQLWTATSDKVTAIDIRRGAEHGNESYKVAQSGIDWKVSGPFEAPASFGVVQGLIAAVANLKAERYDAMTPDPAKHGFDKPALRLAVSIKDTTPAKDGQPAKETVTTKAVVIGNMTTGGRFATLEGGPSQAVFVVPETLLKDTDKAALDLLDKQVLTLDSTKVSTIQIAGPKPEDAVMLKKDDKGVWTADGAAFAVDKPTVDALLLAVSRPAVSRFAGYGVGVKWADYGLEKPEYTATVTIPAAMGDANAKPQSHTIKLGRADTTGERFVRIDDGPALAVLSPASSDALTRSKLDFVDRTMLTFDPAAMTGLVRKAGNEELELSQGTSGGWDLVKPAKNKADGPTLDELADMLSRLRAVKVAAYDAKDLKPFGLDAPAAVLTLKVGLEKPEDKVLKIGGPVDPAKPKGDRYAIVEGRKEVGTIGEALANRLLAGALKFRDRNLAKFVDADRATLVRGDRKVTFAKVDGTWKMTLPTTADAEQADLDELVNALARLRVEELIAEKPADLKPYGLDKPEAVWTFLAADKEVLNLSLGKKDGNRIHAKLANSDLVAVLDEKLTNRVLAEYRKRAVWTGVDAAQIETVAISSGTNNFALRKEGSAWVDPAKPGELYDSAKVTELLDCLAGLKAERYVADKDAERKLYGLDPAERVIVVTQRGSVKTLHLGRLEGGSSRAYARVVEDGRTDVFVLSEADTAKLMRDRAGLRK